MFISSAGGSVSPNLNLLIIGDLMSAKKVSVYFTQVQPQQHTDNPFQFCDKVCRFSDLGNCIE